MNKENSDKTTMSGSKLNWLLVDCCSLNKIQIGATQSYGKIKLPTSLELEELANK